MDKHAAHKEITIKITPMPLDGSYMLFYLCERNRLGLAEEAREEHMHNMEVNIGWFL